MEQTTLKDFEQQKTTEAKKIYQKENVYEASINRINFILDHFPNFYLSFSGGKDSSLTLHLLLQEARKRERLPVKVLFIDLEAQYKSTINHVEEMLVDNSEIEPYWICLPLNLRNAVSIYQPQWICWNEEKRDIWVRDMPKHKCIINETTMPNWEWFYKGMEFEEFIIHFGKWIRNKNNKLTTTVVAIRADESLHRYLAVKNRKEERIFKSKPWTTKIRKNLYNSYPIYDWKTEDIWTAVGKFNLKYNKIYDLMYMTGRSIHDSRICQPYGDDQRQGLDLFRKIEPKTWFKVVERVAGANYGNIYQGLEILGNGQIKKPDKYTWKEYTNFLLNTIPKYQAHIYKERIEQFFDWWEEEEGWERKDVPDERPPKSDPIWYKEDGTQYRRIPAWDRIAKCILKNDLCCKSLSFGCVVGGYPRLQKLKRKYGEW
jgi:predicted phosphoadenosine phosphosulfate sulfurtransferase